MSIFKNFFPFIVPGLLLISISCKKEAGDGGMGTIKGKVLAGNYHSPDTPVMSDDGAAEEPVYIIYGDNSFPDHSLKTAADGSFEFDYLRRGNYTIYAYSMDKNSSNQAKTVITKTIEIKDKKEIVDVPDFVIYKEANKDGKSSIKGKVFLRDYDLAFTSLQNQYYKSDEDVMIVFGNDTINDDKTKTSYDGSFQFNHLRKGKYKIYAFSADSSKIVACQGCTFTPDSTVLRTVEITTNNQEIILPDIVILKN